MLGKWLLAAILGCLTGAYAGIERVYDPADLKEMLDTNPKFQQLYDELTPEKLSEGISDTVAAMNLDPRIVEEKRLLIAGAIYTEYLQSGKMKKVAAEKILMAQAYFPLFDKIFATAKLPVSPAMKFIAWIESGFNPKIVSAAKAVGLWQFVEETGQDSGLIVTKKIDERTNIYASTAAAARHMGELFSENALESWDGVMIAYNAGPGRLKTILKDCQKKDPYLCGYENLRPETQMYIPRLLAASYIFSRYADHGLQPYVDEYLKVGFFPRCLTAQATYSDNSLEDLARAGEYPLDQLRFFNMGLRQPNEENRMVVIPGPMQEVVIGEDRLQTCDPQAAYAAWLKKQDLSIIPVLQTQALQGPVSKPPALQIRELQTIRWSQIKEPRRKWFKNRN